MSYCWLFFLFLVKNNINLKQKASFLFCITYITMRPDKKSKEEFIKEINGLQQKNESLKKLLDIDIAERKKAEKIVNDIIDKNPIPIQILDMEGYTIQVNAAHIKLFGVIPPSNYSVFKDTQLLNLGFGKLFEKIKKGGVVHFPVVYYNAHNANPLCPDIPQWLKAVGFTLNDFSDNPEKVVLMHEDVTVRKQAKDALEHSEKKYRALTEQLPLSVFETNLEGKFTYANKTALETFGYSISDFQKGLNILQMISPEDTAIASKNFQKTLKGNNYKPNEYLALRKNGTLFPSLIHTKAIVENGGPIGISGFAFDISERKYAEMKLRENEQMLQTVLDNFPGVVFWKDTQSNYLGCNLSNAIGAGFKNTTEMIGKNDFDMPWSATDAENYRADDREVIESGKAKMHIIEKIHQVNNQVKWLDTSKLPLQGPNGQTIGVLGVSVDITERKKAEIALQEKNIEIEAQNKEYAKLTEELTKTNRELVLLKEKAEESDRLKTAFLQNMSHEIRTPMNAIMGFSDLLVENYDNKSNLQKFSEIINQRCSDLLEIINDILDISKIESGQLSVNI
jgi:PAS domain S-box-containing protein